MSQSPFTPATTSHAPKRARDAEPEEPHKRQRQQKAQTRLESSSAQAPLSYAPRLLFSPLAYHSYQASSHTPPSNGRMINSGYGPAQGDLHAPGPTYRNSNRQYAPAMQPTYTSGLPIPQTSHSHEPDLAPKPPTATNGPCQQQQTLEQQRMALIQYAKSALGSDAQLSGSQHVASLPSDFGAQKVYHNTPASTGDTQAARKQLYAQQEQWLIDAEADLQGRTITVVPAIPLEQGTVGTLESVIYDMLVPRDVWRLRALSPSQRYAAYHYMAELGRKMVLSDQAAQGYQVLWANIVKFRAGLMQRERAWAKSFKQGTNTDSWARWNQVVNTQAVSTRVDQAMIDGYLALQNGKADTTSPADAAVETRKPQPPTSGPVLAKQKPVSQSQQPISPPVATRSALEKLAKPDTIKHPSDKTKVPAYPFDKIEDFNPNSATGRYQCMHSFETDKVCCKEGLTKRQMMSSISRSILTWKGKVERLIRDGRLHKSHMTWSKYQDKKLRSQQKAEELKQADRHAHDAESEEARAAEEDEERMRNEKRTAANARAMEKQRQRQLWQQQPRQQADTKSEPASSPASNSPQQHVVPEAALSPEETAAESLLQEEITKALKRFERERKSCWRFEQMKKWPNWSRFDEWWAARLLQVQCSQLSPQQEAVLKGPEPSGIPDKDPAFMKKTKEALPLPAQKLVNVAEDIELDDKGLDDLFEDDGSGL